MSISEFLGNFRYPEIEANDLFNGLTWEIDPSSPNVDLEWEMEGYMKFEDEKEFIDYIAQKTSTAIIQEESYLQRLDIDEINCGFMPTDGDVAPTKMYRFFEATIETIEKFCICHNNKIYFFSSHISSYEKNIFYNFVWHKCIDAIISEIRKQSPYYLYASENSEYRMKEIFIYMERPWEISDQPEINVKASKILNEQSKNHSLTATINAALYIKNEIINVGSSRINHFTTVKTSLTKAWCNDWWISEINKENLVYHDIRFHITYDNGMNLRLFPHIPDVIELIETQLLYLRRYYDVVYDEFDYWLLPDITEPLLRFAKEKDIYLYESKDVSASVPQGRIKKILSSNEIRTKFGYSTDWIDKIAIAVSTEDS